MRHRRSTSPGFPIGRSILFIFSTGCIVCTGAKTKEIVGEAVDKLVEDVKELGLAMRKGGFDAGTTTNSFNEYEFI